MPMPVVKNIFHRIGRPMFVAVGCCLLIVASVQGFQNAMNNTTDLQTTAQYLMTISQFLYAALGPCVVVLRFVRPGWLSAVWWAWVVFFITAVALIPWAWMEPSLLETFRFALVALVVAGLMSFLVLGGAKPNGPQGAVPE